MCAPEQLGAGHCLNSCPHAQVASQEGKYLANVFNTTHVGRFAANSPNGLSPVSPHS